MAPTTELVIARHGEAACNVTGIVGGDRGCTGLTDRGRHQATQLAARLAAEHAARPYGAFYSTPRLRVVQTAEIITQALPLPPTVEPALRGPDHGDADGQPWADIKTAFQGPLQHAPDTPYATGSENPEPVPAPGDRGPTGNPRPARRRTDPHRRPWRDHRGRQQPPPPPHTPPGRLPAARLRHRARLGHPMAATNQPVRPHHLATRHAQRHPTPRTPAMSSSDLLQLCRRLLDIDAVPVTWHPGHAGTQALRASTAEHGEVIVKQHRSQERHTQEAHAYRTWIPALGDRAPRLLATTDDPPAIVITAVPGDPLDQRKLAPEAEWDAYRQAGPLLKTLHAARPPKLEPDWTAWLAERAEYWIRQAGDHITTSHRAEVRAHMRALQALAPLPTVPCHLDFMPRNLIHGDDGIVRLIDFEHSRYDLPARDLVRLATRIWPLRPDLRGSFLDKYGQLTTADHEVLEHCVHLDTLTQRRQHPRR